MHPPPFARRSLASRVGLSIQLFSLEAREEDDLNKIFVAILKRVRGREARGREEARGGREELTLTNVCPYVSLVKTMHVEGESKIGNKVFLPLGLRDLPGAGLRVLLPATADPRTTDPDEEEEEGESPKYSRPSLHLAVRIS